MTSNRDNSVIKIGPAQIRLLERLTNACAVSGDEGEVRSMVLEQVRLHAKDVRVDALGNVLVVQPGSEERRLRVLLAAHMDEVGFIITGEDGDGLYRFEPVGGIDVRLLPGKPVMVGKDRLPGVIGAKPVHLTTSEERRSSISLDTLRIDVAPGNGSKVKIGDRATFATSFTRLGPSLRAKALDDRLGVATLIELVRHAPAHLDLLAAFTVQEEVGLRGAGVAAYALEPDLAIVVDSTPAHDLPAWDDSENTRYNTRLGAGPAIYIADRGTLYDPRLVRFVVETAEAAGIPYQLRQPGSGGTDAGAMHKQRAGIPTISISVPGRYPHSPAGIARLSDWKNTLSLVYEVLLRLKVGWLNVES